MPVQKIQLYIILMFAVFPACGGHLLEEIYETPAEASVYGGGVFEGRFSNRFEIRRVNSVFSPPWVLVIRGVPSVVDFNVDNVRGSWPPIIEWLPNPFTEDLSASWERVLNDSLSTKWQQKKRIAMEDLSVKDLPGPSWALNDSLSLSALTKWQQKKRVAAAGYTALGRDKLFSWSAYEAAIADFDKALSLDAENTEGYYYRAIARLRLGNTEASLENDAQAQRHYHAALQDYTQAIAHAPEDTHDYVRQGYVRFRFGTLALALENTADAQRHYHAAISVCNQAVALYRKDEIALKEALAVHTEVSVHYQAAMEIRKGYGAAYYVRGLAKRALGHRAAAKADFQKAKALNPNVEQLYDSRDASAWQ